MFPLRSPPRLSCFIHRRRNSRFQALLPVACRRSSRVRDAASLVPSTDSAVLSQIRCQAHWGHPEHHRLSLNPGWCLLIKNIGGKKSPQLSLWVADLPLEICPPRRGEGRSLAPKAELLCTQLGDGQQWVRGGFAPPDLST